jgi:nucleoid-associated protein YgaU
MSTAWTALIALSAFAGAGAGPGTAAGSGSSFSGSGEGEVTLPAAEWEQLKEAVAALDRAEPPEVPVAPIDRRIEGVFKKGLLSANLVARFQVLTDQGHIRVPVLDGAASIGEVTLDGHRTSLLREGDFYTLGVDKPGRYEVKVRFFWGKEQDRFARRLAFRLPEAGPTEIQILIPEQDIDARLAHGALVAERAKDASGTELVGHIDPSGMFDLSWSRRLTHKSQEAVRLEAKLDTVLGIHEALVSGLMLLDYNVQEGETDRIDLKLPDEVEVVRVEGDAVLQWRTEAQKNGKSELTVLLRYLAAGHLRIAVHYQFPADADKPVAIKMPLPTDGTPFVGAAGIQAPAGLKVDVAATDGARELSPRDVPPDLTELSQSPLLYAFTFVEAPRLVLNVARHQEVELNSTLIDELQASSVVIESGMEVTKLKLRMRNNTRQYLSMHLPPGAILTHSLIDGQSVRPAVIKDKVGREVLLLPLRQSERIGGGERTHVVREGETLSDISNAYFSTPTEWHTILEGNKDQLGNGIELQTGQRLRIPNKKGAVMEESSFVIEVAYKCQRTALGRFGRLGLELPELDVPTVGVTWHLYLPDAVSALAFDANLTQFSSLRYDPFRRLKSYLEMVVGTRHAWAGEFRSYKNILSQRKVLWLADNDRRGGDEVVLSSFPLVGERYRFHRILLGKETPAIRLTYVARGWAGIARWVALLSAFGLAWFLFAARRPPKAVAWIAGAAALLLLLVGAHFFLGLHRRILWGVDLALIAALVRPEATKLLRGALRLFEEPWRAIELVRMKTLLLVVGLLTLVSLMLVFPLLLSSVALLALLVMRARQKEVGHV